VRGKLICFIGIDGAGKTTLAQETVRLLRDRGIRSVGVYGKTVPVLSRLLMAAGRRILLRKENIWQDYSSYATHKKRVMRNSLLARVYEAAVWLDYLPQVLIKVILPLSTGATVVCDRYLFDTVVGDLAVHLNYDDGRIRRSLGAGFRMLPEPDQVFLIDLPEEVAIQRKDDVPHTEYLRERRELYLRLGELCPMHQLDGQERPEELVRQIARTLGSPPKQARRERGQQGSVPGH
jgi:thymidylate kinase